MHPNIARLLTLFLFASCSTVVEGGPPDESPLPDPIDGVDPDDGTPSPDPTPDEGDPSPTEPQDPNLSLCGVATNMGTLGARVGDAGTFNVDGVNVTELVVELEAGPPSDVLYVSLWPGFGVFEGGGPQPGTYSITGAEADPATCGACLFLDADATATDAAHSLIATSGTLTLQSVNGTVSGSAQNLVFAEFDSESGILVSGGCQTRIDSLTFSGS